jgi:hypothetical protein
MPSSSKYPLLYVSLIIFFLTLSIVSATFISISSEISDIEIGDTTGHSSISIKNNGDEAAHEVSFSFNLPEGFVGEETFIGRLDPGASFEMKFNVTSSENVLVGTHPSTVIVSYKDANSYPFSAITPFNIIYKKRTSSRVFGIFQDLTLTGDEPEKLSLSIKNPDNEAHKLKLRLYLPRELDVDEQEKTITIGPSEEREVDFSVSSFSALPRSTYAIFASLSYEKNGEIYSAFARGLIHVVEKKPFFTSQKLGISFLVLILIFIIYQVKAGKWKKAE